MGATEFNVHVRLLPEAPDLEMDVTSAPAAARRSHTRLPTKPEPPRTTIFLGEALLATTTAPLDAASVALRVRVRGETRARGGGASTDWGVMQLICLQVAGGLARVGRNGRSRWTATNRTL
jgi:hypothetical protein